MDKKLTIWFFLFGCLMITAAILAYNRIEKLEDIILKQQETIEIQNQAILLKNIETQIIRNIYSPTR